MRLHGALLPVKRLLRLQNLWFMAYTRISNSGVWSHYVFVLAVACSFLLSPCSSIGGRMGFRVGNIGEDRLSAGRSASKADLTFHSIKILVHYLFYTMASTDYMEQQTTAIQNSRHSVGIHTADRRILFLQSTAHIQPRYLVFCCLKCMNVSHKHLRS